MSHFLHRTKATGQQPVAGVPSPMDFVKAVAPGALNRANAQIHEPRARILKPPTA